MSYWSGKFKSVNIFPTLPNWNLPHKSVTYHIKTGWARLRTCALSVILPFWDAAAVWKAHPCDDETPSARTHLSSLQGKPTTLALFTWNLDRARGTKEGHCGRTMIFFSWGIKANMSGHCGRHGRHVIPTMVETLVILWGKFHIVSSLLSVLIIILIIKSDFDAITNLPQAFQLKMSLTRKQKYDKSYKCLFRCNYAFTQRFDSYTFTKKSKLHFGKSFTWRPLFLLDAGSNSVKFSTEQQKVFFARNCIT